MPLLEISHRSRSCDCGAVSLTCVETVFDIFFQRLLVISALAPEGLKGLEGQRGYLLDRVSVATHYTLGSRELAINQRHRSDAGHV